MRAGDNLYTSSIVAADPSCTYEPPVGATLIDRPGSMTYGMPAPTTLQWTPEATQRLARIPSFVRGVVARRLEDYARDHPERFVKIVRDFMRSTEPSRYDRERWRQLLDEGARVPPVQAEAGERLR